VIGIQDDTGDELIRAYVTLKDGTQGTSRNYSSCAPASGALQMPQRLEIRRNCPRIPGKKY